MILGVSEMVRQLSEVTGQNLVYDGEGCDIIVRERALVLRYRPIEQAWYAIGVLGPLKPVGHPYRMEAMQAALEANFLGRYTMGMQISMFADTLLIADRLAAEGLTALGFAERLVNMEQNVTRILDNWKQYREYTENPTSAPLPQDNFFSFMRV